MYFLETIFFFFKCIHRVVIISYKKNMSSHITSPELRNVAKRNFFKTLGCTEKCFGREGGIYKIFKSWGECKTLFFHLMIFFLNKNETYKISC